MISTLPPVKVISGSVVVRRSWKDVRCEFLASDKCQFDRLGPVIGSFDMSFKKTPGDRARLELHTDDSTLFATEIRLSGADKTGTRIEWRTERRFMPDGLLGRIVDRIIKSEVAGRLH